MKRVKSESIAWVSLALLVFTSADRCYAALIVSNSDPLLSGASIIDFTGVPVMTNPVLSGVSFTGIGGNIYVTDNPVAASPPTLINSPSNDATIDGIDFEIVFSTPVSAFGADFFAINNAVGVEAFNGNSSLGATSFDPNDPHATVFRGLGGFASPITSALVSIVSSDIIILDNFHFVKVPEPGTALLLCLGALGLSALRRRPRRN